MSLSYLKLPFSEWEAMCNGKEAYTDLAPGMLSAAAYREERLHKRIAELEAVVGLLAGRVKCNLCEGSGSYFIGECTECGGTGYYAAPNDTIHIQDPADFDMEKIAALPDWEPYAPADALPVKELIELLTVIRPSYGDVGSRDVEVTAKRKLIDRAIEILTSPSPAAAAHQSVWNDALEEAALICDGVNNHDNPMTAGDCADAIRDLKSSPQAPKTEGSGDA